MLPTIDLPNTSPPLWLRQKLGTQESASSAPNPQVTAAVTAAPTSTRSISGLIALNRAVSLLENAPYRVKPSIDAQFTAMLDICQLQGRGKSSLREIVQAVSECVKFLTNAAETSQQRNQPVSSRPARLTT